jgi:hypothetical protein
MARRNSTRIFRASDDTAWRVEVKVPGSSNAMIVFRLVGAPNARRDRYAWFQADTPEARNVTSRLDPREVLRSLTDEQLALLFRRSMLISAADNPLGIPVTEPSV